MLNISRRVIWKSLDCTGPLDESTNGIWGGIIPQAVYIILTVFIFLASEAETWGDHIKVRTQTPVVSGKLFLYCSIILEKIPSLCHYSKDPSCKQPSSDANGFFFSTLRCLFQRFNDRFCVSINPRGKTVLFKQPLFII